MSIVQTARCDTHKRTFNVAIGCSECNKTKVLENCPHTAAYNILGGVTKYCPTCDKMRVSGFLNKLTGEKLGGSVSGELADKLGDNLGHWEDWVPNPGKTKHESYSAYVRRQSEISHAFGERYYPEWDGN